MTPLTFVLRARPLLSLTVLACTLLLTACMDESCNLTSPSESTGSHGAGATLDVLVYFNESPDGVPDKVDVFSSRGGVIAVSDFGLISIPNMNKGDSVTFTASVSTLATKSCPCASAIKTCTWSGNTGIFGDPTVSVRLIGSTFGISCSGW